MGKISLSTALLLCLLAIATANTFTVTVAQSCQEQIQRHKLNQCRMLLSRSGQYYLDELSMVTEDDERSNQGQEHLQQCCQELRNIDTQCRCPALKRMVTQEPALLSQRARSLPRACNIDPTECHL